jgi:hypothetical protein
MNQDHAESVRLRLTNLEMQLMTKDSENTKLKQTKTVRNEYNLQVATPDLQPACTGLTPHNLPEEQEEGSEDHTTTPCHQLPTRTSGISTQPV